MKNNKKINSDKLKGTIFLVCFLGCALGFVISFIFSQWLIGSCFFIGGILSWVIAALISNYDSKKYKRELSKKLNYVTTEGTVIACEKVTDKTKMPLGTPSEYNYKLTVMIDKKTIVAYYRRAFNVNDKIKIMVSDYYPEGFYQKYIVVGK